MATKAPAGGMVGDGGAGGGVGGLYVRGGQFAPGARRSIRDVCAALRRRPMRLARGPELYGLIAPDGTWHPAPGMYGHRDVARGLGFEDHHAAGAAGYMHVSGQQGALWGHLPEGAPMEELQRARLAALAKQHGFSEASFSRGNRDYRIRLSRPTEADWAEGWHGKLPGPILADKLEEEGWHHDPQTLDVLRGPVAPGHTLHVTRHPESGKVVAWTDEAHAPLVSNALRTEQVYHAYPHLRNDAAPPGDGPDELNVHGPGGAYHSHYGVVRRVDPATGTPTRDVLHRPSRIAPEEAHRIARELAWPAFRPALRLSRSGLAGYIDRRTGAWHEAPDGRHMTLAARLGYRNPWHATHEGDMVHVGQVGTDLIGHRDDGEYGAAPATLRRLAAERGLGAEVTRDHKPVRLARSFTLNPQMSQPLAVAFNRQRVKSVIPIAALVDKLYEAHPEAEWLPWAAHTLMHPENTYSKHDRPAGPSVTRAPHKMMYAVAQGEHGPEHRLSVFTPGKEHRWTAPITDEAELREAAGAAYADKAAAGHALNLPPDQLRLARAGPTHPSGGPGDAFHVAEGPGGTHAVWPRGDGTVYIAGHDENGDATHHFSHPGLVDSYYFTDAGVARRMADLLSRRVRLARVSPWKTTQHESLLSGRALGPEADGTLSPETLAHLDPTLGREMGGAEAPTQGQLVRHLNRIGKAVVPRSHAARAAHVVAMGVKDAAVSAGDGKLTDWYSRHPREVEAGLAHMFGWPADRDAPRQVIAKALLAITSNEQTPDSNMATLVRMLHAGGGDPARIPDAQAHSLDEWLAKARAAGLHPPTEPFSGTPYFHDAAEAARWLVSHHGHPLLSERAVRYKGVPALAFKNGDVSHVMGLGGEWRDVRMPREPRVPVVGGWRGELRAARRSKGGPRGTRRILLPLLDAGALQPKEWLANSGGLRTGLATLRRLIAEKGEDGAAHWLRTEHPPEEVSRYAAGGQIAPSYLAPETPLPGFFAFGPKVGSFASNLHDDKGMGKYLTADLWFARWYRRHLGALKGDREPITAPERREMYDAAQTLLKHTGLSSIAELQAVLWGYEQALWRRYGQKAETGDFGSAIRKELDKHAAQG